MNLSTELKKIAERHGGILQPDDIVKAAEPKNSALHNSFEWDDTKAGYKYRLWQARQLLKVYVNMETSAGDKKTCMFVSLKSDRQENGGYRLITDILDDKELKKQLLQDAYEDMQIFMKKYAVLKELVGVIKAMKKVSVA